MPSQAEVVGRLGEDLNVRGNLRGSALAASAEHPSSVPRTHIGGRGSQGPIILVVEALKPLSGLRGHCTHVHPLFPHIHVILKNYIHVTAHFINEKELGLVTKAFKLTY